MMVVFPCWFGIRWQKTTVSHEIDLSSNLTKMKACLKKMLELGNHRLLLYTLHIPFKIKGVYSALFYLTVLLASPSIGTL